MGSGAVKNIVLLMVLVVLSFLVGAQVSDGMKDSMGAFALIGAVAVGFLLLFLGKNSWYLVFLLPPLVNNLPVRFIHGALAIYFVSIGMFAYYFVQCKAMRYTQMKWHSVPLLDGVVLLILCYMCVSYYRFPVSIDALGLDMEYVGGRPYVYAAGASVYFLYLSLLNVHRPDMEKVVRWAFYVQLLMMVVTIGLRLKSGNIYWSGGAEGDGDLSADAGERRITLFVPISFFLLAFAYASRPLISLFTSPMYLGTIIVSLLGISLSGARNYLLQSVLYVLGISVVRREIAMIMMMGVAVWIALFGLGRNGVFENIPLTAQRFLAVVPGVRISKEVRKKTNGSSDVRLIAWKQAFEPRNGYIRDYIWGDGFQKNVHDLNRHRVAHMRGIAEGIRMDNNNLARSGNWHNGFIYTMHRLGLVACALFYTVFIVGIAMFITVGRYYVGKPFFPYFCAFGIPVFETPFTYSYNSRTPEDFFAYFVQLAFVKLLYCQLREQGEVGALFRQRQRYVPMMIQHMEENAQKA